MAHGLDIETGPLKNPLTARQLKIVFPTFAGSHRLTGTTKVDYLLGIRNASWHPEKVT